jgi:hypothetical protein
VLTPVVFGPREVPLVTDVAVARERPELAVLSALVHGGRDDRSALFTAFFAALDVIDHDHANLYTDLVLTALPAAARAWLEESMGSVSFKYTYQSDFARRYFGEGEAKGEANALLAILDARQVPVPDDIRADIVGCTDLAQLEEWIRRAATADKIEDVLG